MKEQVCNKCNLPKPLDKEHYHVNSDYPNGFVKICKECKNAYKREKRLRDFGKPKKKKIPPSGFEAACLQEELDRGQTDHLSIWS